jgi:hypothetical protein
LRSLALLSGKRAFLTRLIQLRAVGYCGSTSINPKPSAVRFRGPPEKEDRKTGKPPEGEFL